MQNGLLEVFLRKALAKPTWLAITRIAYQNRIGEAFRQRQWCRAWRGRRRCLRRQGGWELATGGSAGNRRQKRETGGTSDWSQVTLLPRRNSAMWKELFLRGRKKGKSEQFLS